MSRPAEELPAESQAPKLVEYEQPLTERMRTFLRLEFLYQQALFHAEDSLDFGSRAAIHSLLEIITILTRGDVRAETLKELERQADVLKRYGSQPTVDQGTLGNLLENAEQLREQLIAVGPHFLSPLKESDFLNSIKHRSAIPGGTCVFDLPDYAFWLTQPFEVRAATLENWLSVLRPLCDSVAEVLWLIREGHEAEEEVAAGGMFQHSMERSETLCLLRVLLPAGVDYYPEISGSTHRFTVRFLNWTNIEARPTQVDKDVPFLLALC